MSNNLSKVNKYREDLFVTKDSEKIINLKHSDSMKYPNINLIILKYLDEENKEEYIEKVKKTLSDINLTACSVAYYPSKNVSLYSFFEDKYEEDCLNKIININFIENNKDIYKWLDILMKILMNILIGIDIVIYSDSDYYI